MKLAEIFKVNYSKGVKKDEVYDWSIQSAIVNIVEKDCVKHFCDYIATTDIKSLTGLEKAFYYKLRKNLKHLYLKLDMDIYYSYRTKEQLLKAISIIRTVGTDPLENMTEGGMLNYLTGVTDEKAYKLIIEELNEALQYTRFQTTSSRVDMELDILENDLDISDSSKQYYINTLKEFKGDK